MPYCVVRKCKNSSNKQKSHNGALSFHKFPVDEELRKVWVSIVRQNRKDSTWTASRFCVICSDHFKEEDIYYKGRKSYRCLKKFAKPVLEKNGSEESKYQQAGPSKTKLVLAEVSSEIVSEESNCQQAVPSKEKTTEVDNNLNDINDSDFEKLVRKEQRRHHITMLMKRKISTLNKKLRKAKQRNVFLKSIIKKLRDKYVTH